MTLDEMKKRRESLGLTYEQLSRESGVPLSTVQKVFGGITKSPRYATLQAIEKALLACERQYIYANQNPIDRRYIPDEMIIDNTPYGNMVKEPDPAYIRTSPARPTYTAADRDKLPDDRLTELIDGVFYDMASPRLAHQLISAQIHTQLVSHIQKQGGPCLALAAPLDVYLDNDDKTVMLPDLMIVCDRSKLTKYIYGAPDMIIEILSPSTRKRDQSLKLYKYASAGVREYWIIDPGRRTVVVYDLEAMGDENSADPEKSEISLYHFHDQIPVRIWDGSFSVDMAPIAALMDQMQL